MVVIFAPPAALTGIEHERTGRPFMCTVQAPHCATPQPYLVPVRPTCSRITLNRGRTDSGLVSDYRELSVGSGDRTFDETRTVESASPSVVNSIGYRSGRVHRVRDDETGSSDRSFDRIPYASVPWIRRTQRKL